MFTKEKRISAAEYRINVMTKTNPKSMNDLLRNKVIHMHRWLAGNFAYAVSHQTVVALARRGTLKQEKENSRHGHLSMFW
jgi:hypothetical protein